MNLEPVLSFAKTLIERAVSTGDVAVDATVGNGHDTVFLANLVGESGHVYGFDIQREAIEQATQFAKDQKVSERITMFESGHEHVSKCIPDQDHHKVKGAIFNLGYLPGGDKAIVTKPATTITAIEQLLEMMGSGGMIVIVIYHGHTGGQTERDQLLAFVTSLDQKKVHVLQYGFINQKNNPPFIIALEQK